MREEKASALPLPLDVDVEALFEHHLGMYRENFQKILERFPDFFVRT